MTKTSSFINPNQQIIKSRIRRHLREIEKLERQLSETGSPPSLCQLIEVVSEVTGLDYASIVGHCRSGELPDARKMVASLGRKFGYTYALIGEALGNRHHTSVIHLNITCTERAINETDFRVRLQRANAKAMQLCG